MYNCRILKNVECADTELLIYATKLINKALHGLSDQDSFYDESDCLEQHGMENIIQYYMSKTGTDLDLLDQFQLYEKTLRFEDGEMNESLEDLRKTFRYRSRKGDERRKSWRHLSVAPIPPPPPPPFMYQIVPPAVPPLPLKHPNSENDSSSSGGELNGFSDCKIREGGAGVTPGLRRRRERAELQRNIQTQQETVINGLKAEESDNGISINFS